jgi:phosphatidylserine/phosphatidylglycerophosphate/cardiolipin synthase-like enzyme
MIEPLQRGWNKNLNDVFQSVEKELIVSSPYVSIVGAEFLLKNVSQKFRESGILRFVTDLSPKNIYQGSTDPKSFKLFFNSINSIQVVHLPRLHAKVYISDANKAIVTSGNLTAGGIYDNFEYGIFIKDSTTVLVIKNDLINFANLGAQINSLEIDNYCEVSEEIKELYKQKEKASKKEIEIKLRKAISKANDELIKIRLAEGSLHSVFEKTILYLLHKNGPLPTVAIHNLIEEIHPDLCDNSVDRVIDGARFGKKWKHAVRTAQQHLKKKGLADLINGNWTLTK